ncbi:MAG: hypothetical protein MN733_10145, partial [Nitrososphaera sp.]|nr:hypothetical protein [Nitrososphaera sp.]
PAGQKVMFTVSLRQIPAMITSLLGLEDSPFAGESLPIGWDRKQALEGHETPVLVTLNYEGRRVQSVKWDRWLYIHNSSDPGEELYDLAADPLAKKNLATTSPVLARMRETLQQLLTTEAPSTKLTGASGE